MVPGHGVPIMSDGSEENDMAPAEATAPDTVQATQPGPGHTLRLQRRAQKLAEDGTYDLPSEAGARVGTVMRKARGIYWVSDEGVTVVCSISSKLRKDLAMPEADPTSIPHYKVSVGEIAMLDPVAVGDIVRYVGAGEGRGMITEVLPRRNKLSRKAAGPKPMEQVIVANVDQVIPLFAAARPEPKWGLLDRYLADAEMVGLPAIICITKCDLVDERSLDDVVALYRGIGYTVILTSAATNRGFDELKEVLEGRLSVLTGKSGVGKTTLLNTLQPGLGLKVNEVGRNSGKGKHTTSNLELYRLDFGGSVVDTPGMREFGLWNLGDRDAAELFPEMRPFLGQCQFHQCTHVHEPGCAILGAVASGLIAESRYRSLSRLK
jgi:ribosome biogenesis GTPase